MRLRGAIIEYNLTEAAMILKLPAKELREKVREGQLRCFYHLGGEYKFHDAVLKLIAFYCGIKLKPSHDIDVSFTKLSLRNYFCFTFCFFNPAGI